MTWWPARSRMVAQSFRTRSKSSTTSTTATSSRVANVSSARPSQPGGAIVSADLPRTPYHIGEQSASTLLGPVLLGLAELEQRLEHYRERLHMPDADRATIGRARDVLAGALAQLRGLA